MNLQIYQLFMSESSSELSSSNISSNSVYLNESSESFADTLINETLNNPQEVPVQTQQSNPVNVNIQQPSINPVAQNSPNINTPTLLEAVKTAEDIQTLSFKGTRFENWETFVKTNGNLIYTDPTGKNLLEIIKKVSINPTVQEQAIILSFFKDHEILINDKMSKELENTNNAAFEAMELKQKIFSQNEISTNVLNNKNPRNQIGQGNPNAQKYAEMGKRITSSDSDKMALDLLSDNGEGVGIEGNFKKHFNDISLTQILNIYKNSENSKDSDDVLENEIDKIVRSDLVKKSIIETINLMKSNGVTREKIKIVIKTKISKVIKKFKESLKESMQLINDFIKFTQKAKFDDDGNFVFSKEKIFKNNLRVSDLKRNSDFKKYVDIKKIEFNENKTETDYQEYNNIANKIGGQILQTKEKINISETPITYGSGLDLLSIENINSTKGELIEGLYVGGDRYRINGIDHIESIIVDGDSVTIKGQRIGEKTDIKLNKDKFVEGIKNMILHKIAYFESDDGVKFDIRKTKV